MDKLPRLSEIIKQIFTDIALDENRNEFIFHFKGLMRKPLVKFGEAYTGFIGPGGVSKNSDTFDLWLNIQMRVITALGPDQDALKQLVKMFQDVLKTTEGGEVSDCLSVDSKEDFERYSFIIALAFKIYLDDFPTAIASEANGAAV